MSYLIDREGHLRAFFDVELPSIMTSQRIFATWLRGDYDVQKGGYPLKKKGSKIKFIRATLWRWESFELLSTRPLEPNPK